MTEEEKKKADWRRAAQIDNTIAKTDAMWETMYGDANSQNAARAERLAPLDMLEPPKLDVSVNTNNNGNELSEGGVISLSGNNTSAISNKSNINLNGDFTKKSTTTTTTTKEGGEYNPALIDANNPALQGKPFEETTYYQNILKSAKEKRKGLEGKYANSRRNAKWAAWSNLAQALGQIGGLGKATPQTIDNSFYKRAMADVDKYSALLENEPAVTQKELDAARKIYNDEQKAQLDRNLKIISSNTGYTNEANKYNAGNKVKSTTTTETKTEDPIALANLKERMRRNDIAAAKAQEDKDYNKGEYTMLNFQTDASDAKAQHMVNKNVLGSAFDKVMDYYKGLKDDTGVSIADKIISQLGMQPDEYSRNYYMGKTIENAFINGSLDDFQRKELSAILTRGIRR